MKYTMVIPTYWGRKKKEGWREGDAIYDHPTPLDEEGTLRRAVESTGILKDKDFRLAVIAVATSTDIEEQVEEKVKRILKKAKISVPVSFFSHSNLKKLHNILKRNKMWSYRDLCHLRGYSNIRNICLILAALYDSDAVLLIDDDEYFHDPGFMRKAKKFIGNNEIYAVAGYYVSPDGSFILHRKREPWMTFWNKIDAMNFAFERIIATSPRLKPTPFVFGGNMVIHKWMFRKIPFDPYVTRGEDIDYLMNAKMFEYDFYLDNRLAIVHDPPPKTHPKWQQMREDIYRFSYSRSKIQFQTEKKGMRRLTAHSFDPYPGEFLKIHLEEKIFRSSMMLALEYLKEGDRESYEECMRNIQIVYDEADPGFDPFENLISLQKRWSRLMRWLSTRKNREKARKSIEILQD